MDDVLAAGCALSIAVGTYVVCMWRKRSLPVAFSGMPERATGGSPEFGHTESSWTGVDDVDVIELIQRAFSGLPRLSLLTRASQAQNEFALDRLAHGDAMAGGAAHEESLTAELEYRGEYPGFQATGCPGITLEPDQARHLRELYQVLQHSPFVLDFSETGTGKTVTSTSLAKAYGYILVIAPKNVCPKWVNDLTRCGFDQVDNFMVLTWESFSRGSLHGFLQHEQGGEWVPTDRWLETASRTRPLLIFDEAHKMKNSGTGFSCAARAILEPVIRAESQGAKAILLSATLTDTDDSKYTFMDVLGMLGTQPPNMLAKKRVWDNDSRRSHAMPHLITWCEEHGGSHNKKFSANIDADPVSSKHAYSIALAAWREVVIPRFARFMVTPQYKFKQVGLSAQFPVADPDEYRRVKEASLFACDDPYEGDKTEDKKESLFKAIGEYELAKVPLMGRVARQILDSVDVSKVVIAASRREAMAALKRELQDYGVIVLDGDQSLKEREIARLRFQEDSSLSPRVTIGQISVMAAGIDLDDQTGTRPRTTLTIPQYRAIDLSQLMGRTHRRTTRSHSTFAVVYAKEAESDASEHRIGTRLDTKARVIREPVSSDKRKNLVDLMPWDDDLDGPLTGIPPVHLLVED